METHQAFAKKVENSPESGKVTGALARTPKMDVFGGRGVEGKGGKGDRVNPIPEKALTRRYP